MLVCKLKFQIKWTVFVENSQWLSPFLPDTLLNSPILVVEIGEPIMTK